MLTYLGLHAVLDRINPNPTFQLQFLSTFYRILLIFFTASLYGLDVDRTLIRLID